MATAKRLPSGNWRVRATFTDADGIKHTESFTERTARKAEAQAALWQAGMLERKENKPLQELGVAMAEYIETCRCAGLSPATIRSYLASSRHAFDMLKSRPINMITTRDIQLWINARSKTVSPKTVKNNLSFMLSVLKANEVYVKQEAIKLPKRQHEEMEIPSDAQVTAILQDVYDDDDMYIAVMLAALMGLRRSEICALKWSDISVHDGVAYLEVSKALVLDENDMHVEKSPKTNAGRRILPIPSALYAELKSRRALRPTLVSITPNAITERYMRVVKRLGTPLRFHNLRHYHASVMLREGVPEKYIVADMGHSSFDMVKRVYGHVMQEKRGQIATAMDMHASSVLCVATNVATPTQKSL